jgi:YD repeat-containing protein
MRSHYLILLFVCLLSCKKSKVEVVVPAGTLLEITANGKVSERYEYANGLLISENLFMNCETPAMVISYKYDGDLLRSVTTSSRGMTSSLSTAMCDPSTPVDKHLSAFEYDAGGRLKKAIREKSVSEYEYNAQGLVAKITQRFDAQARETFMQYDSKGNLIEKSGAEMINGDPERYEYDNQTNPFFAMKRSQEFASPFNSRNNVIKAFDKSGKLLWERKFTYNNFGLPTECLETNGITYQYHY